MAAIGAMRTLIFNLHSVDGSNRQDSDISESVAALDRFYSKRKRQIASPKKAAA
jgi:hypothetical protein